MKVACLKPCLRLCLLATLTFPFAAFGGSGEAEEATFRGVNDIVSELNPLDVIANHGGIRRSIDLDIRFALNSAQLLPAAKIQVEALAQALLSSRLDGYNIKIIGHTDASGSAEANADLSARRASMVIASLTRDYGVNASRLSFEGKGETSLLKGLAPTDPRQRRVEIVAVAQAGDAAKMQNANTEDDTQDMEEGGEKTINW